MSQSLLQGDRANLIEKIQVVLFFPPRQHRRAFNVTDSFAFTVPGFCSSSQGTVIDQTSTAHRASEQGFLLSRGIETVLESSLRHILHYSNYSVTDADFNVKPC